MGQPMQVRTPGVAGRATRRLSLPSTTLALFGVTIFVGSALVFLVEPMVGKMVLPLFGGAPAVWAVSLLFFQAALLAGYAFAHVSHRVLGVRRQALVQLGLLLVPLALLPIVVPHTSAAQAHPAFALLVVLAVAAGAPFFVVSTASPVLQRWYSASHDRGSRDPYFLYAASNAGSLLGLLAYPALLEPRLTLTQQSHLWAFGYVAFALLTAVCALRLLSAQTATAPTESASPRPAGIDWRRRLRWIGMAALPSSLMLGTTTYITTDVAAVPLLWVIPLALYLLSFVFAFARQQLVSPRVVSASVAASSLLAVASILHLALLPIGALVAVHTLNLFLVALLVHRRLALERPPAEQLTAFYLLLSFGGVCGGIFNALLAPVIFNTILEYPIAIVLALLLRTGPRGPRPDARFFRQTTDFMPPLALAGLVFCAILGLGATRHLTALSLHGTLALGLFALLFFARRPVRFAVGIASLVLITTLGQHQLVTDRTFFGVLRVVKEGNQHHFLHGVTLHGIEDFAPGRRDEPLTYFSRQGPIGQVFAHLGDNAHAVGIIGLGAGSLAAYGHPDEQITFYEIDPGVAAIASNPRYFTFLHDSQADVRVVLGDGRITIARARDHSYDLIVLDAFSSDAIPVHLLTREAVQLYLRKLRPDGLIAFHITNSYLDLAPVVAADARALHLRGYVQTYTPSPAERRRGVGPSVWAIAAPRAASVAGFGRDQRWTPLHAERRLRTWTDEYSNVLSVANWLK